MRTRTCSVIAGVVLCCWSTTVDAIGIKGTVRSASADTATIGIEGESAPNVGDPVEVYFKLPGADTEISVGSGKVTAVRNDSVEAEIDKATGTVSKDQLARITSAKPQKRSEAATSPASPPAAASTNAIAPAAPSSSATALTAATPPADSAYRKSWEDGLARYNQNDYDGAIAAYTKAIEANPDDSETYFNRGVCYEKKSDWTMAMDDFSRAISMNPNLPKTYTARAHARIMREDYGPALLEDFNKAIALDGNYAAAYFGRGIYYAHERKMKLAEADWKRSIALDPTVEEFVKQNRDFFHTSGKPSRHHKR